MSDIFKEQLVKREKNTKDDFKKMLICAISVAFSILAVIGLGLGAGLVIVLVIALIASYFIYNMNIEYEYSVTNGDIDIDRIYNKSRRKRVFSGSCGDIEIMAHINDKEHLGSYTDAKVYDFSSGGIYGNTYVFVTEFKGKKAKIVIEPNDEILNAMAVVLTGRKLFKNKNGI